MIVLLYGANEVAIRRRLQELKDEADGGTGMLESNLNVIDGREAKPGEIVSAVMASPFLSAKRLVIIERLLERYEGQGGGQRGLPKAVEQLVQALEGGLPDSTILVFLGLPFRRDGMDAEVTEKNPLVARLAKLPGAKNEHHGGLKGPALVEHIRGEATRRGLTLRPGKPANRLQPGERMPDEADPAALMAALFQSDTLSIGNELDKLALYTGGGDVSVVEVNRVCSGERDATSFNFRDAVLDGNLALASEYRDRLLEAGLDHSGLLWMLSEAYRGVARIVDAVEDGANPEEIGRLLGNAGKFPRLRDDAIRRARAIGSAGLKRSYESLLEAERTHKLGEVDEAVAFDILLARLCEISRPAPRRRRA